MRRARLASRCAFSRLRRRRSVTAITPARTHVRFRRRSKLRRLSSRLCSNHLCSSQPGRRRRSARRRRSEEHTSELQSRPHLVCRLLLEKKKPKNLLFLFYKKKNII